MHALQKEHITAVVDLSLEVAKGEISEVDAKELIKDKKMPQNKPNRAKTTHSRKGSIKLKEDK